MKRTWAGLVFAVLALGGAHRAFAFENAAFVYDSTDAIKSGAFTLGVVTPEGVLVALPLHWPGGWWVGPVGGDLVQATAGRADFQAHLLLLVPGEKVVDPELQSIQHFRSTAAAAFLPTVWSSSPTAAAVGSSAPPSPVPASSEPFEIRINDKPVGSDPIVLPRKMKKSHFTLTVVRRSGGPVWDFHVRIASDPKLGFWKEGHRAGLNEVPSHTFEYSEQALIQPYRAGSTTSVSVEVLYIDKPSYDWTITAWGKDAELEKHVVVQFQ